MLVILPSLHWGVMIRSMSWQGLAVPGRTSQLLTSTSINTFMSCQSLAVMILFWQSHTFGNYLCIWYTYINDCLSEPNPPTPFKCADFILKYQRHRLKLDVSVTLMLLVTNLTNPKLCKHPEKWLNPWHMGTHPRALNESYPMNANMTGFSSFSKNQHPYTLDESSFSIGRVIFLKYHWFKHPIHPCLGEPTEFRCCCGIGWHMWSPFF